MTDDKHCAECGATGELTRLEYKGKKTPWLCPKHSRPAFEGIAEEVVKDIDNRLNNVQTKGDSVTAKKTERQSDNLRLLPLTSKQLPCKLTNEELRKYGEELANTIDEVSNEEARQESVKKEMKSTLTGLQSKLTILSSKIRRGEEYRDVQVQPEMDFKQGVYREVRTDTGAIITERPLTDDERQEALPFGKATEEDKPETKPPKAKKASKKEAGEATFDQPATT